jgi:hypothetical protein
LQIQRLRLKRVGKETTRLVGNGNAARLCARLEARRQIGRIVDDGLLLRRPLADERSDDNDSDRHADTRLQRFSVARLESCDAVCEIKSRPQSLFGVVLVRAGKPKINEDAVANEFGDEAVLVRNHTETDVLIAPNASSSEEPRHRFHCHGR